MLHNDLQIIDLLDNSIERSRIVAIFIRADFAFLYHEKAKRKRIRTGRGSL